MKKQNYILKIEKPCSESWTSMTTNEIGKFCSHCTENVVDFSKLTDNEVLKVIENSNGKLCGRFYNDQLNRILLQTNVKSSNPRLYKIIAGLLLISSANNINANGQQSPTHIVSLENKTTENLEKNNVNNISGKDSTTNVVQGQIFEEESREPLDYPYIRIKDTEISVMADSTGKFIIVIPENLLSKEITIQVIRLGYETEEFSVRKKDLPVTKKIYLTQSQRMLKGRIGVHVEEAK